MTTDTQASSWSSLVTQGLITDAQRDTALAHPLCATIGANADPARHLVWMVKERILSHGELLHMAQRASDDDGPASQERSTIFDTALRELTSISGKLNATLLDKLFADGLISEPERELATQTFPQHVMPSPGFALARMVVTSVMSRKRFNVTRERVLAERGLHWADRVRVVEEAQVVINASKMVRRHFVSAFLHEAFPPSPWLWLIVVVMLGAGYQWYRTSARAVPACDEREIINLVQSTIFSGLTPGRVGEHPGMPKLQHVKQVGYASAQRQRGCTASLSFGDKTFPFTYIVGPLERDGGELGVMAANSTIVSARFSRIRPDGNFSNNAEPLGRDKLGKALRAAAEALHQVPGRKPMRQATDLSASMVNPDRLREIADIEPLGACREIKAGTQYSCPVLVERNDSLMAAVGMPSQILQAEFTFERDAGSGEWRMSDDFPGVYAHAIVDSRLKQLKNQ